MNLTKLDNTFSKYIRLRDRLNDSNVCRCISCGKLINWKDADAGHYINRKHMSVRFNEQNVNAQCRACNRYDEGFMSGYSIGLIEKYGKDIVHKLILGKNQTAKFSQFEINELEKYYKKEVEKLLNK